MQHGLGDYTFVVFSVLAVVFWFFVWLAVPETRGRSIEEVSARLTGRTQREVAEVLLKEGLETSSA